MGHSNRIIKVSTTELKLFAKIFDGKDEWEGSRLPVIHAKQLLSVLEKLSLQPLTINSLGKDVFYTTCFGETQAISSGSIIKNVHFPNTPYELIYSGAHIGVANPLFKTSRKDCSSRYDFDPIDLSSIPEDYLQRCNFSPLYESNGTFFQKTEWGSYYDKEYRIVMRRMLNIIGERTLMPCIIPPRTAHISTVFGLAVNKYNLFSLAGIMASLVMDFYVIITSKADCTGDIVSFMPLIPDSEYSKEISARTALLNCLNNTYSDLVKKIEIKKFTTCCWSKTDMRLNNDYFSSFDGIWTKDFPIRNDYARRFALVEIDVLTAMSMGITKSELVAIYKVQFPTLFKNESDTWYDANGRIVFTCNTNLPGIGFTRKEWENGIKGAPAGQKFYRTITDDTMPGGPVERTIEYVAPFDRCDREQDYETAWRFFEEKYGNTQNDSTGE